MPVVLFEDRATKVAFVVIGVHVPTRRDASTTKRLAINARIIAFALRCERRGFPVIVAGDRNDGHLLPWVKPFKRGVQHQVDWVLGSARVTFSGAKKLGEVYRKVTDHHAMILVKAKIQGGNPTSDDLP
jgi:elongation factor P hydroxylase